jgi:hypothetical protein
LLEVLEDRYLLSAYIVNSTADDGSVGTLRDAINQVNAGTYNEIDFTIGAQGSQQTINLTSVLPQITVSGVTLNGLSQGGSGNSTPLIQLDGGGITGSTGIDGLQVMGSGCTVSGLVLSHFHNDGLFVAGSNNLISDNYLGTDLSGTVAAANGVGAVIQGSGNTIGSSTTAAGNLISGNTQQGLYLNGTGGNLAQGNFIGTDVTGTKALGNGGDGVVILESGDTIGGTTAGARNLISGNAGNGITLLGTSGNNVVENNYIGTNLSGTIALGNGQNGVEVLGSSNSVGCTVAGARNLISGNTLDGVLIDSGVSGVVVQGNFVGLNYHGNAALANGTNGVEVQGTGNTIGGDNYYARNYISGNKNDGLLLGSSASGTLVQGNFIGTNGSGKYKVGNVNGIEIAGTGNTIGGTDYYARNLLSGNSNDGVLIASGASGNLILGDDFGTDTAVTGALGNSQNGIEIKGTGNTVGGTTTASRNVISGNRVDGIVIAASGTTVLGNYIGVDKTGAVAIGNSTGVYIAASQAILGGTTPGVHNVISGNSSTGVLITTSATGAQVEGNYIGTNAAGTSAVPNHYGIQVLGNSDTIGGSIVGARNIISGNNSIGVNLTAAGTQDIVAGNYIGTNAAGTSAVPNSIGVYIKSNNDTIGGASYYARNIISGNSSDGIGNYPGISGALIQGNFVGTDYSGTKAVPNKIGVDMFANQYLHTTSCTIGGTSAYEPNLLSGNSVDGLYFSPYASGNEVVGNLVGTNLGNTQPLGNGQYGIVLNFGNTIGGSDAGGSNIISSNGLAGIYENDGDANSILRNAIFANGPAQQGPGIVAKSGTSNNPDALSLGSAVYVGTTLTVKGTFTAPTANVSYVLEFFANPTGDPEGKVYLGSRIVKPTTTGVQSFTFTFTTSVQATDPLLTATLTDSYGSTSGFSDGVTMTPHNSYVVTSTADDGSAGTLRAAIAAVNAGTDDEIDFNIPTSDPGYNASTGTWAINLGSALTLTANDITLSGLSQGGSGNTTPLVELSGTGSGDGLLLNGSANIVSGFLIENFGNGVEVAGNNNTIGGSVKGAGNVLSGNSTGVSIDSGVSGVAVQGNFIGTDATGSSANGNTEGIDDYGSNNTIGGSIAAARNLVSGDGQGIVLESNASRTQVQGNYIGTDVSGNNALSNAVGIAVYGSNNTIGGTIAAARNVISGNGKIGQPSAGVWIGGSGVTLLGNYIGTNAAGTSALGNSIGVEVAGASNTIGGTVASARNIISGSSSDGVLLDGTASGTSVLGNFIGLNVAGNAALGNGANGVEVQGVHNGIGGGFYNARNYISGNADDGVLLDSAASGNEVGGNVLGLNFSVNGILGNSNGVEVAGSNNTISGAVLSGNSNDGVLIDSGANGNLLRVNNIGTAFTGVATYANGNYGISIAGSNNTIGGMWSYFSNRIAGNQAGGILVSSGNGNTIEHNSIYANGPSNTGPGIVVSPGANNNLSAPAISTATLNSNTLTVTGTFNALAANVSYLLEFFDNPAGDPEGKVHLGDLTVTPTSTGTQSFTFTVSAKAATFITATLTDASGDTSAFSNGVTVS